MPETPRSRIQVTCRPAREADTAQVMALTARIWEGHDYVPHVWAGWLADPEGRLAVAELEGRVVGLGKITRLTETDWWLEGLRVLPELEGRGVAAQLHDYLVGYWQANCRGVLRLVTNSKRYPVHHLCERTGFEKTGEYGFFAAAALDEAATSFTRLDAGELDAAFQLAINSPTVQMSHGLIDLGWEWLSPRLTHFEDAAAQGKAWRWQGSQKEWTGVLLARVDEDEEEEAPPSLAVMLAAAPVEALAEMAWDLRRLASAAGYARVAWTAPLDTEIPPALEKAGFERTSDFSVYVFTKRQVL